MTPSSPASSGGFLGGSLLDFVKAGTTAYKDIKTFDLQQNLLEAQARQINQFSEITRDSNINAATGSPVLYVPTNSGEQVGQSAAMNPALIFGAVALIAVLVLK